MQQAQAAPDKGAISTLREALLQAQHQGLARLDAHMLLLHSLGRIEHGVFV